MRDTITLVVSADTPLSKLDKLEEAYFKCLRSHPDDFDADSSVFLFSALVDSQRLQVSWDWRNGVLG